MDIGDLLPWLLGGGTFLFTLITILCSTLPFVLIIGGVVYYLYNQNKKAKAVRESSRNWLETKGVVVKSRVEVTGGETTTVTPHVVYEYRVGAQTYQGQQIKAGDRFWNSSTSRQAYDTVDRYPEGAQVVVYYNPANPAESALER